MSSPDVIALVVLWRLRYKLSLRDLPEMFAVRGMVFSYEAVREWETKLTPALAEELRRRRRGGRSARRPGQGGAGRISRGDGAQPHSDDCNGVPACLAKRGV